MKIPIFVIFLGVIRVLSRKVGDLDYAEDVSESFSSDVDGLNSGIASSYNSFESRNIPFDDNNVPREFRRDVPEGQDLEETHLVARQEPSQEKASDESAPSDFQNVHTLIVNEIIYETKVSYYTHTAVAFRTKCCRQKPHYTRCSETVPETTATQFPETTATQFPANPDESSDSDVPTPTSDCNVPATGFQCVTTIIITASCGCSVNAASHTCGIATKAYDYGLPSTSSFELEKREYEKAPDVSEKADGSSKHSDNAEKPVKRSNETQKPSKPENKVEKSSETHSHNHNHSHDHDHNHTHDDKNKATLGKKNHGIRVEKLQKIELVCIILGIISGIWIVI
ncbi:hypothetical protein T552_02052 [Pneumocystis carinii B80]|uniref:Uncharacterized protein n=1 Tax=Pneumocystis carinii (strain B80) TaxID=1408658 RepID=A0A0W4ZGV9_PNEC8|nr:hypothetical protein T552_02052 [Pneumocystis carinii B80]KTW27610.1 hypothetical protein T552_02052 [Pneumocystis carinii B80]